MQYKSQLKWLVAALMSGSLLIGCGGGGGGGSSNKGTVSGVTYAINSPAQIAQESAADYNDNVNGLITATTLKRWMTDWTNNRPAGISGKLIIFQVASGPVGSEYIKPDGVNVFTYLSGSAEWTQTRNNGVIETPTMVPDGATMDGLFKKYNIDPTKDMIVAAMGNGSTTNAMAQGRIWYALRYWGVDKTHLAILNGGNQWINTNGLTPTDFQASASTAPNNGSFSVKNLHVDNTQLQITAGQLLQMLPSSDMNVKGDGIFIWDARSMGQYSAGYVSEKGEHGCTSAFCAEPDPNNYNWSFQNGGSRQGHPNGTLQLQYTLLLDSTKGFSYRPKADLMAYLSGALDANGLGFAGADYTPVGSGNAYQSGDTIITYCETTMRAMITGVASAVIMGKPTRFYDGAMIEWNSLSHLQDKDGQYLLPANSPWRTDVRSFFRPNMSMANVNPRTVTDPYAPNTNRIINEDRGYKTGESAPSGGGGSIPGNPCGG